MHNYERTRLFINGEWVPSAGTQVVDVVDPSTEEVFGTVPGGTAADVDAAVAAGPSGIRPLITVGDRRERLAAVIATMEKRLPNIAETITREMGAPIRISQTVQTQVPLAVAHGFAAALDSFEFEADRQLAGRAGAVRRGRRHHPDGTIRCIRSSPRCCRPSPPGAPWCSSRAMTHRCRCSVRRGVAGCRSASRCSEPGVRSRQRDRRTDGTAPRRRLSVVHRVHRCRQPRR